MSRLLVIDVGLHRALSLSREALVAYVQRSLAALLMEEASVIFRAETLQLLAILHALSPTTVTTSIIGQHLQTATQLYSSPYTPLDRQLDVVWLLFGVAAIVSIHHDNPELVTLPAAYCFTAAQISSLAAYLEHTLRAAFEATTDVMVGGSIEELDACCHILGSLLLLPLSYSSDHPAASDTKRLLALISISILTTPKQDTLILHVRVLSILLSYLQRSRHIAILTLLPNAADLLRTLTHTLHFINQDFIALESSRYTAVSALVNSYSSYGKCAGMLAECRWRAVRLLVCGALSGPALLDCGTLSSPALLDETVIASITEELQITPTAVLPDLLSSARVVMRSVGERDEKQVDALLAAAWTIIMGDVYVATTAVQAFISLALDSTLITQTHISIKYFDLLYDYGFKDRPHIIRCLLCHLVEVWRADPMLCVPFLPRIKQILLYKEPHTDDNGTADVQGLTNIHVVSRLLVLGFLEYLPGDVPLPLKDGILDLIRDLIRMNTMDPYVRPTMIGTELFGHKLRSWQALCVLSKYVDAQLLEEITLDMFQCLEQSCIHGIRVYMEIFTSILAKGYTSTLLPLILGKLQIPNHPQQTLASYFIILGHLFLDSVDIIQEFHRDKIEKTLLVLSPWLACGNGLPRSIAQVVVQALIPLLVDSEPNHHLKTYLWSILTFLNENKESSKLVRRQLGFFRECPLLERRSVDSLLRFKVEGDDDIVPTHLLDVIAEFYKTYTHDTADAVVEDGFGVSGIGCLIGQMSIDVERDLTSLQTKRTSYHQLQLLLDDQHDQLSRNANDVKKQPLVVIASLVDKVTNLAGTSTIQCHVLRSM
jgi:hypothetical protein